MILEDLMNILRSRGNVLVVIDTDRSIPKECKLVGVSDFIRIDDYLPDDYLAAHVVGMNIDEVPVQIIISMDE